MIDLHTHSTISDGALTPKQLVQAAAQNGCRLLALTDHDHTGGLAEARAEAARHGLLASAGSDFHRPHDYSGGVLGACPELPGICQPVWEHFKQPFRQPA